MCASLRRLVGGGFGGKSSTPSTGARQAQEAARLARAAGKPVQVVWDRAEEFFYTNFRPAAVVKIRAGLSGEGKIVSWVYQVWAAGPRDAISVYDIPNQRTTSAGNYPDGANPPSMHPFGVGPWRGPAANTNTFARESHLDILAAKAGVDPVEFRLNHLTDPRLRRALETAAAKFGWKPAKAPSGRGVGMACGTYKNESRMVTMAEVAVDKRTGHVQVKRVVCVMDQGLAANPEGSPLQLEGGIIMGMGYTLDGGDSLQGRRYPGPRLRDLPDSALLLGTQDRDVPDRQPVHAARPDAASRRSSPWAR